MFLFQDVLEQGLSFFGGEFLQLGEKGFPAVAGS
jgi:hypothetical protein